MHTYHSSNTLQSRRFARVLQSWFPAIHQKTFPATPAIILSAARRTASRIAPRLRSSRFAVLSIVAISLLTISTKTMAAEPVPTNQPNNGFYQGADPEWATLHATSLSGTAEHRQYHRDAAKAHSDWHEQNRAAQGTSAYANDHRYFHQERNRLHRLFHTAPINP